MIEFIQRFHAEMWWDRWAMVACCVLFVAGVELAAWGGRQQRRREVGIRRPQQR
jgi:hypothetical protein